MSYMTAGQAFNAMNTIFDNYRKGYEDQRNRQLAGYETRLNQLLDSGSYGGSNNGVNEEVNYLLRKLYGSDYGTYVDSNGNTIDALAGGNTIIPTTQYTQNDTNSYSQNYNNDNSYSQDNYDNNYNTQSYTDNTQQAVQSVQPAAQQATEQTAQNDTSNKSYSMYQNYLDEANTLKNIAKSNGANKPVEASDVVNAAKDMAQQKAANDIKAGEYVDRTNQANLLSALLENADKTTEKTYNKISGKDNYNNKNTRAKEARESSGQYEITDVKDSLSKAYNKLDDNTKKQVTQILLDATGAGNVKASLNTKINGQTVPQLLANYGSELGNIIVRGGKVMLDEASENLDKKINNAKVLASIGSKVGSDISEYVKENTTNTGANSSENLTTRGQQIYNNLGGQRDIFSNMDDETKQKLINAIYGGVDNYAKKTSSYKATNSLYNLIRLLEDK